MMPTKHFVLSHEILFLPTNMHKLSRILIHSYRSYVHPDGKHKRSACKICADSCSFVGKK